MNLYMLCMSLTVFAASIFGETIVGRVALGICAGSMFYQAMWGTK